MPYIEFTEEEKVRANEVSLEDYLLRRGERLVRAGSQYKLVYHDLHGTHDSISIRGNRWYDHKNKVGGDSPKFLKYFYGMTYPEAVEELLGGHVGQGAAALPPPAPKLPPPKPFELPPASSNCRRLYAYLLGHRHISREVLDSFIHARLIYESCRQVKTRSGQLREFHDAVFVGVDAQGVPRHAHLRSLNSSGRAFRLNVEGCDAGYSFHYVGTSPRLYVFEAPIDLLSFLSLYPRDWQEHSYVALCGTSEHAMLKLLDLCPWLKEVCLCTDHDPPGIEAAYRLRDILQERGGASSSLLLPQWKDWNEDVKARLGLPAEPAAEHPHLLALGPVCQHLLENLEPPFSDPEARIRCQLERVQRCMDTAGGIDELPGLLESVAAQAIHLAIRQYRHLERQLSPEQAVAALQKGFRPHLNKARPTSRIEHAVQTASVAYGLSRAPGARLPQDVEEIARVYGALARECLGILVFLLTEADLGPQHHVEGGEPSIDAPITGAELTADTPTNYGLTIGG